MTPVAETSKTEAFSICVSLNSQIVNTECDLLFITKSTSLYVRGCIQKFRTGRLERELQMVQLSATTYSCIAIFVSQSSEFCRHNPLCCFLTSVYCSCLFRYDSVRKRLDTTSYETALRRNIFVWNIQTLFLPLLVNKNERCWISVTYIKHIQDIFLKSGYQFWRTNPFGGLLGCWCHLQDQIISSITAHYFICRYFVFVVLLSKRKSHDSSVGIALGYGLDDRGSRIRFSAWAGHFSLHYRVQNGSGAHRASYPMGTRVSFPGGKAAGAWNWPLTFI
jgi:hypothetical protein